MSPQKNSLRKMELIETIDLDGLDATRNWIKTLIPKLSSRHVLGLQGTLGSGKTHFVKNLAELLGFETTDTNSPTFALHHQYQAKAVTKDENLNLPTLHHWDLYRLESEDEVESSGLWDLFYETKAIIAIEWIDRIKEDHIPLNYSYWRIEWEILKNEKRRVSLFQG